MTSNKWEITTAEKFCLKVTDGTHDSPKRANYGKRLITSKHLDEFRLDFDNAYLISEDDYEKINLRSQVDQYDILFSMIGTVGTIYLEKSKEIQYAVKNVGIFKSKSQLDAKWLYYYLKSNYAKKYLHANLNGSTQQYITLGALRKLPILNPDSQLKEFVVDILSSLEDKIEINNKINSNLEELAQTLYKRWFVDFEFPNEEGKPYKSSGGEMVESELGLIPKGWEVKSLREIMDFQGGFSFKGNRDNLDLKYKIITIKNVQDGYMDLSGVSSIEHKPNKLKESQVLQIGDVLVSLTGNVGRTCIVNQENCLLNQRVEKISPIDTELQGFNYFLFRSSQMNSVMQSLSKGSAQQNLSPVELSNQKIAITNELVAKFDVFNSLFQSILNNQIQNMSLTKTRDLLLPKLMSGEIEV